MKKHFLYSTLLAIVSMFIIKIAYSAPFENCPTKAFLIQKPSGIVKTFGIDLATGSYTTLSDNMGSSASYNAVGFSDHDDYIYGWDHASGTLAQVGNDYQVQVLPIIKDSQSSTAGNFVAGDVAVDENSWYGYRGGEGLFKVYLDGSQQYLMNYIDGSQARATVSLTDLAFHPDDGFIYAVTNGESSQLLRITPDTGEIDQLGQIYAGTRATFGAQFFDIDGNLYISNNKNGYIYKIDLNNIKVISEVFAYGPKSSSNDGARCANAPIEIGEQIDFGDAPSSYGSLFADNGARHNISSNLKLGTKVSAETDPRANGDNDDGIAMPTGFQTGATAIVTIDVAGMDNTNAYLNAWIDWDLDGQFDSDEQVITDLVASTNNTVSITVPAWAQEGDTWARYRLSSTAGIGPSGGVSDGEVEDYELSITQVGVSLNYYPSSSTYTTLAYEDMYPIVGDYDMNDVVMKLRIVEYIQNETVYKIRFIGKLAALGAGYHNGFAVRLENILSSNVRGDSINWKIDGVSQTSSPLKLGSTEAIIVFSDNLTEQIELTESCNYYRAQKDCLYRAMPHWQLDIELVNPVAINDMPSMPYDPYIFASSNRYHGSEVANILGSDPGYKLEVHLKNKAPTSLFHMPLLGASDDRSNADLNHYFFSDNGMAWGIEVPIDWQHPLEKMRLDTVYPEFIEFAKDNSRQTNPTWYTSPDLDKVYLD